METHVLLQRRTFTDRIFGIDDASVEGIQSFPGDQAKDELHKGHRVSPLAPFFTIRVRLKHPHSFVKEIMRLGNRSVMQ